jgi:teichuronic acid biosynthesis glycosyltransferase TuaH
MIRSAVAFKFAGDMLEAARREFCWPLDQTLLTLAADHGVGRPLVVDSLRSLPVSLVRRRPVQLREQITIAGRAATRLRPQRFRRTESTSHDSIERAYHRYGRPLGKALAREQANGNRRLGSTAVVTYDPFLAAFADGPWIRKVVLVAQDGWATGECVRPWWPVYREAYRRIDERKADIFAVSEEVASRISLQVIEICQDFAQRRPGTAFVHNLTNIGAASNFNRVFGEFVGFLKLLLTTGLLLTAGQRRGLPLSLEV